jgi:thiol-disulfide isomerase/thioredoxin
MNTLTIYKEMQIDLAFTEARSKQLPVVVDFWSDGCKGCKKMEDVTYKDEAVIDYLETNYVFVKYDTYNKQPGFRNTYISSPHLWTPTLLVFSNDGSEVRKATGYLPPKQLINELQLGKALAQLRKARSGDALDTLNHLLASSDCDVIKQEALYWAGVAAFYANKKSLEQLVPFWEKLMEEYPGSRWAERADCLDVIL